MPDVGNITHFHSVNLRVVGFGNLNIEARTMNDLTIQTMVPITMTATDSREEFRHVNFVSQKARFKFGVDNISEYFRVNKIVLWLKPIATQYPG